VKRKREMRKWGGETVDWVVLRWWLTARVVEQVKRPLKGVLTSSGYEILLDAELQRWEFGVDMQVATVKTRKARRRIARVDRIWLTHDARELKTITQQQRSSQCRVLIQKLWVTWITSQPTSSYDDTIRRSIRDRPHNISSHVLKSRAVQTICSADVAYLVQFPVYVRWAHKYDGWFLFSKRRSHFLRSLRHKSKHVYGLHWKRPFHTGM
jgi:hypothetical protein